MTRPFVVRKIDTFLYRCPISTPVQTSFGLMYDRPMLLVRIIDTDGYEGWGEIWCNFPAFGAKHRKHIVDNILSPILLGGKLDGPEAAFTKLTDSVEILSIQSGEPGPFAQAIAGIDIALWDLAARRQNKPLWRFLGGESPIVPVYASGLNPTAPERLALKKCDEGYRAFKLKVGFGQERDIENLQNVRAALGDEVKLMVDANQGWDLQSAKNSARMMEEYDLSWLEEPLKVTRPQHEWEAIQKSTSIPLAGGENLVGHQQFDHAISSHLFGVIQPDMAKWGGFSGCLPIARKIAASGASYCPHYLGGGIGLLASAHLLAAVDGDGILEIDSNENPLRSELCGPLTTIENGTATLSDKPGLGFVPDLGGSILQYEIV